MKYSLILSLLILSLQSFASNPDFPILSVESTNVSTNEKLIMETVYLENALSSEKLVEWSAKNLAEGQNSAVQVILTENEKHNQEIELFLLKLKIRLGILTGPATKALAEYRVTVNEEARRLAGDSKKFLEKHERISLSILRTVVNGSTVSAGLVLNGGLSPEVGLAIGFFSGSLSGFFQYFNASFQRLIDGNHLRNQEIIKTKKYGSAIVKTRQMSKWFFTEVSLYAAINTFTMAVGVPMGEFSQEAIKVLKSSAMATGSQGLWDSTIATETRSELRNAEGNPTEQARIQMKSNIKTFAVSMASVFGGVMSLMGANIGSWSLGALGVTGIIYTYYSYKKRSSAQPSATPVQPIIPNCRSIFAI